MYILCFVPVFCSVYEHYNFFILQLHRYYYCRCYFRFSAFSRVLYNGGGRIYIYIYKSCEGDGSLERVPSAETANRVLIPTAAMLLVSANFSMPFFFRVVFLPREITSPRLHIYCWYNQGIVRCITGFVFIGKITE